jgi:hypothetical protein
MRGVVLLAVALSACARPAVPPPAVEVRTVTVDRPVAVPCVRKSDIPAEPAKIGDRLTGDARRDLDLVSASALRLRAWGRQMVAVLTGCAR